MCGIFGCYARAAELPPLPTLARLTNTLAHRGPDGGAWWSDGPFFLGHRRLSIIDLVTGDQPMATADARLVVTFNGEIYNHVELRAELEAKGHVFRSASDTEVLLHGWRQWDTELPRHLVGMFAFAIVDRQERTLFLARDRFGEKPLFVVERGGCVVFASEVKTLAAYLGADAAVDEEALADFLCFNYVPGDRSLLAGVERVVPGGWRLIGPDRVTSGVYHRAEAGPVPVTLRSLDAAVDEAHARLDRAVRGALRSDVPVTLFLSGGIDSSLVADSAVRLGGLKEAFCADFAEPGFSEWDGASHVAQTLGLKLNRVRVQADLVDEFSSVVDHADDPVADASTLPLWALARETARRYKVALSGDGGDELFGGYDQYRATLLHRQVVARLPGAARAVMARAAGAVPVGQGKVTAGYKLRRFLRAAELPSGQAHFTWSGSWLPNEAARMMATDAGRALARAAASRMSTRAGLAGAFALGDLQAADARESLVNGLLVKVDRMTMAFGLETRAPLLDAHVAELGLSVAGSHHGRMPWSKPKRILRALADRRFGSRISGARKQGFSPPVDAWLRGRGGAALREDLLAPGSLQTLGLLDAAEVGRVNQRFVAGEALGFELFGLLVLVAWHRQRVQRPTAVLERASPELRRVVFSEQSAHGVP